MRFDGIYTPIVTPHRDDHSIDRDRFAEVAEHLIAAGVHGIIVAGTTGEYYAQTDEERVELMRLAKDVIKDRVPLIVGTGAIRTEDSVWFAEQAKAAGADETLNYRDDDFVDQVLALTDGQGVDRIAEVDIAANAPLYDRILAPKGASIIYGTGRPVAEVPAAGVVAGAPAAVAGSPASEGSRPSPAPP